MNNISFVIFTYNEEKRIEYVVKNFIKYGEVLILDDGSTDRTKEIAENLGAKYFRRPKTDKAYVENEEIFDFIKRVSRNNWIYWGFVDNIAPKRLLEKLTEISLQDKVKAVSIPLWAYLWGNTNNFSQKGYSRRFFHKDFIDFSSNSIHGMGNFTGSKDQELILPNKEEYALRHFSTYNLSKFVNGHLGYAEIEALGKYEAGKKFSLIRTIAAMMRHCWVYRKSLKNKKLGFIITLSYAFFRFMVYARLYELEQGITLENIEENYSAQKEIILKDFN